MQKQAIAKDESNRDIINISINNSGEQIVPGDLCHNINRKQSAKIRGSHSRGWTKKENVFPLGSMNEISTEISRQPSHAAKHWNRPQS